MARTLEDGQVSQRTSSIFILFLPAAYTLSPGMGDTEVQFFAYRHEPMKTLYMLYAVLCLVFVRIPYWTLSNLLPAWRPRPSWSLSRTLRVNLLRNLLEILFQTSLDPMKADPEKLAQSADKIGFVWIEPDPSLVVGEIKLAAEVNSIAPVRIGGIWYGQRGTDGRVGYRASSNEKVIYELHGEFCAL